MPEPIVALRGIKKYFPIGTGLLAKNKLWIKAVDGIDLDVHSGETVGLVGESGCGKSTTGRMLVGLLQPTTGTILFNGKTLGSYSSTKRGMGKHLQMIFQDPYSSLDPRMTVADIVAEPLVLQRVGTTKERRKYVDELLERVGMSPLHGSRYPDEFSGGQRQRIGIARALAVRPQLIVCDEPVSALDVSIQAQILNLLKDIQKDFGLSYLFIAHGLQAVKYVSNRIAVMYLGKVVEIAEGDTLFAHPRHPYTQALLSAIPQPDPTIRDRERILLSGDLPSPSNPPKGCRFHTRCRFVMERCKNEEPALIPVSGENAVACFLYERGDEG